MINVKTNNILINPDDSVFDHKAFLVRRKSDRTFVAFIFCIRYYSSYMQINKEGDFVVYTINQNDTISSLFDNTGMFEFIEVEEYTLNVDAIIKGV